MNWRTLLGAAMLTGLMGFSGGVTQAAEEDTSVGSVLATEAQADNPASEEQRYGAPPPAYRHHRGPYRVYRPTWRLYVPPPPVFRPGWFGFYFFGAPTAPVPPPAAPHAVAPQPRNDFRHLNQYSLSLTAGGLSSFYKQTGQEYTDPGLRVGLRYRNTPVVGAELSLGMFGSNMRMDGMGEDTRKDFPVQLSGILYAFPRTAFQPYFLFGVTGNMRTYDYQNADGSFGDPYTELRVGPHLGVGLELHVGRNVSLTGDVRSNIYTMVDRRVADQTAQSDATFTGGLNFFF